MAMQKRFIISVVGALASVYLLSTLKLNGWILFGGAFIVFAVLRAILPFVFPDEPEPEYGGTVRNVNTAAEFDHVLAAAGSSPVCFF